MPIEYYDSNLRRSIRSFAAYVGGPKPAMEMIGQSILDYIRTTIRTSGRTAPYAPLAELTIRKTGRDRPLIPLIPYFGFTASTENVTIWFHGPGDWSATQHHRGYTIPARTGLMRIPMIVGKDIWFRSSRAAKVPARQIWPAAREALTEVQKVIQPWLEAGAKKSWK